MPTLRGVSYWPQKTGGNLSVKCLVQSNLSITMGYNPGFLPKQSFDFARMRMPSNLHDSLVIGRHFQPCEQSFFISPRWRGCILNAAMPGVVSARRSTQNSDVMWNAVQCWAEGAGLVPAARMTSVLRRGKGRAINHDVMWDVVLCWALKEFFTMSANCKFLRNVESDVTWNIGSRLGGIFVNVAETGGEHFSLTTCGENLILGDGNVERKTAKIGCEASPLNMEWRWNLSRSCRTKTASWQQHRTFLRWAKSRQKILESTEKRKLQLMWWNDVFHFRDVARQVISGEFTWLKPTLMVDSGQSGAQR